jgi:membrane protease YdiL (CAAX protease family)
VQGHSIDAPAGHRSHVAGDWRTGKGRATKWDETVLAVALLSIGAGVLLAAAALGFAPASIAALVSTASMWIGMAVAIGFALRRARPSLLVSFRPVDVLYGVVAGASLRLVQGWLERAAGGSEAFPAYPTIGGRLSSTWWIDSLVGPVVISPVLEEFFFRGVLLVTVFMLVRRIAGRGAAMFSAVAVNAGAFVLLHSWAGAVEWDAAAAVTVLALTCSALVLLTGRIWGAVLVHAVYNATFVALALMGTLLA